MVLGMRGDDVYTLLLLRQSQLTEYFDPRAASFVLNHQMVFFVIFFFIDLTVSLKSTQGLAESFQPHGTLYYIEMLCVLVKSRICRFLSGPNRSPAVNSSDGDDHNATAVAVAATTRIMHRILKPTIYMIPTNTKK